MTATTSAPLPAAEPLVDLREALRELGFRKSDRQVLRWRLQHELPCYRIAGRLYARVSELRAWINARQTNAPPAPVLDQRAAETVLAAAGCRPRGDSKSKRGRR